MAHDVFVSYSSKDKPIADAVVAGLENNGIRCWVAPRDIVPGVSWGEAIIQAIESSRFMVIILSGNSNSSNQVVREVERAVANNVIIIPFRIENIDPTGAMAYFLATEHWLDAIGPPLENHINKLANTIQLFKDEKRSIDSPNLPEARSSQSEISKKTKFPRWAMVLVSGLVIISIGLILLLPELLKGEKINSPQELISSTSTLESTIIPTLALEPVFNKIGEYRTSGSTNGLFITENNILYLASGTEGLIKISVADPTNPKPISIYQASSANDVVVDGNIVYYISGDYGKKLVVADLGGSGLSTTFPNESSHLEPTQSIYDVIVVNNLLHITGHNYWSIHDVTDPIYPVELWSWEPPSHSGNPCIAFEDGDIAYIGCGWAGIFIFDISDPGSPMQISQFETSNWVIDIKVANQIAYVTLGESGMISLDVTDTAQPIMLDKLPLTGFSSKLALSKDYAYILYLKYDNNVLTDSGLTAVDISNPEGLVSVALYDDLFEATDIQVINDNVFISDEPRGVFILHLDLE